MKHLQKDIAVAVVGVVECVAEIRMWTSSNFLKLNDSKTEVIVFGSAQQLKKTELNTIRIGYCLVTVTHDVRNLGVQFDADMRMESQVTAVCKSAICHLRTISRIRRYLTAESTEQVIHAFVTSRLDVGNALLHRLPLNQIRLQIVQNWAARLVDGATELSLAIPLLINLRWLPIAVRVELKNIAPRAWSTHWSCTRVHPTLCEPMSTG